MNGVGVIMWPTHKEAIHVIIHLSSNLLDVWVCVDYVKEMGTSPKSLVVDGRSAVSHLFF